MKNNIIVLVPVSPFVLDECYNALATEKGNSTKRQIANMSITNVTNGGDHIVVEGCFDVDALSVFERSHAWNELDLCSFCAAYAVRAEVLDYNSERNMVEHIVCCADEILKYENVRPTTNDPISEVREEIDGIISMVPDPSAKKAYKALEEIESSED